METEEIKRVVIAQREEIKEKFEKTKIIEREVDKSKLRKYLSAPNILVVLGIRRCGKSIFSLQIFEGTNYGYINFDDERLAEFHARDFEKLLQSFYELYGEVDHIILDEPHNIDNWELFVNRLRRTKKIILTGSNSRLLSGELASRLTGRYIDFTLFPFSFYEFLNYNNVAIGKEYLYSTKSIALVKKSLNDYLRIGGLPEAYLLGREIIVRIFSDIVEKDIIRRLKIKKKSIFKEVAKYLISNSSCEITLSKLKNIFEIKDLHTIKDWIDGMEEAYLIKIINRFSPKLKEQFIAPKKVYCNDTGIVNAIGFKLSEDIGKIIENVVAVELLRRKSYFSNALEIFYWKDYQQNEVDFVLKEGLRVKQLIQVTYASAKDEIEKRELKALLKASKLLRCKNLLIITWDYEDDLKINGKKIKCSPLWKWLLIDRSK
ncbi:MAG: ATP-binding protein [Candidatus Aenigmarchaeota archaeon]|nr:ATP-binding protein [Candidatus Aenigmarchaeota archaeon]